MFTHVCAHLMRTLGTRASVPFMEALSHRHLTPIPEVTLSLVVGKEIQKAKKIPMNASGRGDDRRKESPALIQCRVAGPILVNLPLCAVTEHMTWREAGSKGVEGWDLNSCLRGCGF